MEVCNGGFGGGKGKAVSKIGGLYKEGLKSFND
jgi:hypothetical protein